jgi:hypothetical protein
MSAKAGPVAAQNPHSTVSGTAGKPISMPSKSVIRANAKAGNQPACMAAIPTISSWANAATVA